MTGRKRPNYSVRKTQGGGCPKGSRRTPTEIGLPAYIKDKNSKKVGNPEYWRIYQEKIRKPRRDAKLKEKVKSAEQAD